MRIKLNKHPKGLFMRYSDSPFYSIYNILEYIHKTETLVPDHQLTVPEQKSCGKDINVNPF
jgi:hypothetical protein